MWITIFGPQFLTATRMSYNLPEELNLSKRAGTILLIFLGAPILLFLQKIKVAYLNEKLKINSKDKSTGREWEKSKRLLNQDVKLELGLETIYQVTGNLVLIFLAYSHTPTYEGLEILFKEEKEFKIFILVLKCKEFSKIRAATGIKTSSIVMWLHISILFYSLYGNTNEYRIPLD